MVVSFTNDMIKKFSLTKEEYLAHKDLINTNWNKIDWLTLTEYIKGEITEEKFNESLSSYKTRNVSSSTTSSKYVSEVVDTTGNVNPEPKCKYNNVWPWGRCVYCNRVRRYDDWSNCSKYNSVTNIEKS